MNTQDLSKQNTLSENNFPHTSLGGNRSKPVIIIVMVIVLSLVFGAVGGVFGFYFMSKNPQLLAAVGNGPSAPLQPSTQNVTLSEDSAIVDVVKKARPAVVSIVVTRELSRVPGFGLDPFFDPFGIFGAPSQPENQQPQPQQVGAGSGFLVSEDGLILTNKHVVSDERAAYTVITSDGQTFDAQVLARDPVNDLAIMKIDIKGAPKLELANSASLQIGQRVVAIGYSLGQYENTVTSGIVSGIGRSITAGGGGSFEQLSGVIQTDAAINPGNSGGPLLNIAGQVIGINTAVDRQGQLVGFAIPAEDGTKALASFKKNGKITRPFLGIRYITLTKGLAEREKLPKDYGALLVRGDRTTDFAVMPGSPADKAGLAENDIILEIDGKKIDEQNTLSARLKNYNAGDEITLKVYHRGEERVIKVVLGEM